MAEQKMDINELSIWDDAKQMLNKAKSDGIETAWDRLQQQSPHCKFGETGVCCRICTMGPCRISKKSPKGVCGADADVIVARNFGRFVTGGAADHSDHGRDCIEALHAIAHGQAPDYTIKDEAKLVRIADEVGIETKSREVLKVAKDLASEFFEDYGTKKGKLAFIGRVSEKQQKLWGKLGIRGMFPDRAGSF